jgi:CelD/BcsL family acetyltransferase involved in cellulose biosynthesis/RimJ/RimL family protein N-acetyltransferase
MSVFLARGNEAKELFHNTEFQTKWQHLFEICEWSTVFQSLQFLEVWHRNYQEFQELIIVYEHNERNELIGLFPLSFDIKESQLCVAGTYHSEYQTWLATNENRNLFIDKSLDLLEKEFPKSSLKFMFLAPNSPLEWLDGKWGTQSRLQKVPRPLVEIGNGEHADNSLRKKNNKGKIKQLKRSGDLQLVELKSSEDFAAHFDEIEDFARLRMSALHNVKPNIDGRRKAFHLDLVESTDLLYPTILKVGENIASAQICVKNRDQMLLCVTAMSPVFANQSPSKIHILFIEKELAAKGISTFDLSPGDGYKDRFATHHEDSYTLNVFFDKTAFAKYKNTRRIAKVSKEMLERLNIRKTKAFTIADKILHKLKRVKPQTIPITIAKNIQRKIYEKKECRFYYFDAEKIKDIPDFEFVRRNSIEDLLKYQPTEGWQFTTSEFHQEAMKRLADGAISYTFADENKLLHYGWLLENQEVSRVSEVGDAEFHFPPNTAVLFDFYTHSQARGKQHYQKSLSQMLHIASQIPDVKQVFIGVLADNVPSRKVIEKIGFQYHSSLFQEVKFGKKRNW